MKSTRFFSIYISVILLATIALAFKPDYNWDMLPYMAILEKMDGVKSFDQVHADIYNQAEKKLTKDKYAPLVNEKDKYRKLMAENASAFEMQLPFFDIKPVYLFIAFIFYKIGVSLTYATVLPSLISYFFINVISFLWCKKFNLPFKALITALFFIGVLTIPLATRSNPDTLACLFLLISSYLFLETDNFLLCVLFLIFSILTRPENIIFSFLMLSIVVIGKWKKKVPVFISLLCILLMALVYYFIVSNTSYPGWNNLFYHAFIDNTVDPSIKQTITIPMYLNVIRENVFNIKGIIGFIFLIGLSAFIFSRKNRMHDKNALYIFFYVALIIWAITKTLLFPMPGLRFIIPPTLLLFFVVAKEYSLIYYKKNFNQINE
jgi:hypothetical protein